MEPRSNSIFGRSNNGQTCPASRLAEAQQQISQADASTMLQSTNCFAMPQATGNDSFSPSSSSGLFGMSPEVMSTGQSQNAGNQNQMQLAFGLGLSMGMLAGMMSMFQMLMGAFQQMMAMNQQQSAMQQAAQQQAAQQQAAQQAAAQQTQPEQQPQPAGNQPATSTPSTPTPATTPAPAAEPTITPNTPLTADEELEHLHSADNETDTQTRLDELVTDDPKFAKARQLIEQSKELDIESDEAQDLNDQLSAELQKQGLTLGQAEEVVQLKALQNLRELRGEVEQEYFGMDPTDPAALNVVARLDALDAIEDSRIRQYQIDRTLPIDDPKYKDVRAMLDEMTAEDPDSEKGNALASEIFSQLQDLDVDDNTINYVLNQKTGQQLDGIKRFFNTKLMDIDASQSGNEPQIEWYINHSIDIDDQISGIDDTLTEQEPELLGEEPASEAEKVESDTSTEPEKVESDTAHES